MVDPFQIIEVQINGLELNVPVIIHELFSYIRNNISEGIFRINGSIKKVNQYYSSLSKYNKWLNQDTTSIYDICSLLKKVLNTNYEFINLDLLYQLTGDSDSDLLKFNHILNTTDTVTVSIFIYTINVISEFLQYHDITKMTIMNFAIIFQPIFIKSTNLILLPNFINLIKLVIENKECITILESTQTFETPLIERGNRSSIFMDSAFFYKFKNFKNKSIDSINESFKYKLPNRSNETVNEGYEKQLKRRSQMNERFRGYKLQNGSMNFIEESSERSIDRSDSEEKVLEGELEDGELEDGELEESDHHTQEDGPQDEGSQLSPNDFGGDFQDDFQDDEEHFEHYEDAQKSPSTPKQNQKTSTTSPQSDLDSINRLVKLNSINSQSFAFNFKMNSPVSSSSYSPYSNSYHSVEEVDRISERSDDNELTFGTLDSINEPQTESDSSPRPDKFRTLNHKPNFSPKDNRVLRDSTNRRHEDINKRKSFINLLNDGVKRNFTLKFKSKSVY